MSDKTKVFHIVGKADIDCPEEYAGTIIGSDKIVRGYVTRFKSPKGNNTFKATLKGYTLIKD